MREIQNLNVPGNAPLAKSRVCGFLGCAVSDEAPRQLVPVLIRSSGSRVDTFLEDGTSLTEHFSEMVATGIATHIAPEFAHTKGYVLFLVSGSDGDTEGAPGRRFRVHAESGANNQELVLLYGPGPAVDDWLADLADRLVDRGLSELEHADVPSCQQSSTLALRASQRTMAGRVLLWLITTVSRADGAPLAYERYLQSTIEQRSGVPDAHVKLANKLVTLHGAYARFKGKPHQPVCVGVQRKEHNLVLSADGTGTLDLATSAGLPRIDVHSSSTVRSWRTWRTMGSLWERILVQSANISDCQSCGGARMAEGLWRTLVTLVAGDLKIDLAWVDDCRMQAWERAFHFRRSGCHAEFVSFVWASLHANTVLILVRRYEPSNYLRRAQCYEALGRRFASEMQADATKGLALPRDPDKVESDAYQYVLLTGRANAQRILARSHLWAKEWNAARSYFERARALFSRWIDNEDGRHFVHERYAQCCYELGRLSNTRSYIEEASRYLLELIEEVEATGDAFNAGWLQLADCKLALGQFDEAARRYQEYVRRQPKDAIGYDKLRVLYRWIGATENERECIDHLRQLAEEKKDAVGQQRAASLLTEWCEPLAHKGAAAGAREKYIELYRQAELLKEQPVLAYRMLQEAMQADPLYAEEGHWAPELAVT